MNLPPDKVEILVQYDNEKKWELICDQVLFFPFFVFLYLGTGCSQPLERSSKNVVPSLIEKSKNSITTVIFFSAGKF